MNLPPRRDAVRHFWVAIRAGASTEDAVAGLGNSRKTGPRYSRKTGSLWFRQAGGVVPAYVTAQSSGRYLSFAEREEIHGGVERGDSIRLIARRLGRAPSTVFHELRRNMRQRPAEVEDRAIPGHWEGDLLMGKNSKSAIGTLVERSTRFVMLLHLPKGHSPTQVEQAIVDATQKLPDFFWKSLTWDQGLEMRNHFQIKVATGLQVYFCDPASPWQRGSNENTNGLLRQYFPKSTDLSQHDAEHLDFVAAQLNRRPRETLAWLRPAQALGKLLSTISESARVATTECIRRGRIRNFEVKIAEIGTVGRNSV